MLFFKGRSITLVDLSSSQDVKTFNEEDNVDKVAQIYIYASKLQSLAVPGSSISLATGFLDLKALMHWSVVVIFESSGAVYTFDADTSGSIVGGEIVVKVKRELPSQVQRKIWIGSTKISPSELVRRARCFRINDGKYDFVFANCQSWAYEFCREISPESSKNLPLTIGKCTGWAVTTAAVVSSMCLTGIYLYKAVTLRKNDAKPIESNKKKNEHT